MKGAPTVEVLLETGASAEEVEAVRRAFADVGIEADVEAGMERRGVGDYAWVLVITTPLGFFLKSFIEAAGKDAYSQLRQFIGRLYEARRPSASPPGTVIIIDSTAREWVQIPDQLPEAAWRELFRTEIGRTKSGSLKWDDRTQSWRDVLEIQKDAES